jgi:signal transduction histidine kinase
VLIDISARVAAEAALAEALEAAQAGIRTRTLFLAMMSHELRTPLQAVLGYADFLLRGAEGALTANQVEDIGAIRQGAGRMVALIDQLLDLSRMEAGRLQLAAEPVVLETILDQVRQDVAPHLIAKALAFAIHLPPALPPVRGDALRVRQILLNLVGNAVKFTEAGAVAISAHRAAGGVTVLVRDTGIGISTEALPHIFEEFRQVDSRPTRRYGGAGLGLAIAKKLAEQMGGRLSVASTLGAGSTFALWLPVAPRQ